MKYEIKGENLPVVICYLEESQLPTAQISKEILKRELAKKLFPIRIFTQEPRVSERKSIIKRAMNQGWEAG